MASWCLVASFRSPVEAEKSYTISLFEITFVPMLRFRIIIERKYYGTLRVNHFEGVRGSC
jgi:hypothetical protein